MELLERRALLKTQNNPNKQRDYIITLQTGAQGQTVHLSVRYIPDKMTLQQDCFDTYIAALFSEGEKPLEETATQLVEDMNNELVPRWIQINAFQTGPQSTEHSVVIEDKQPNWENPHLMSRLAAI